MAEIGFYHLMRTSIDQALPPLLGRTLAAGQRAYQAGSDQVARTVTKQPIEALFLAGAIGFLVGWAVNRT